LSKLTNKKNIDKDFDIKEKVIIITGASKGIGKSIAEELNNRESIVYGIGRSLKKNTTNFNYTQLDINNHDEIKNFIKKIYNKHKKIDGLVNVAGVSKEKTYNLSNFQDTIETNLISTFYLTKETIKYMKLNKKGSIINFTSIGAFQGFSNNPGYIASKAGLNSLTKAIALDNGKFNIRVNNIVPGYIKTDMTKNSYKDNEKSKVRITRTILKRWGNTKDLVGPTIFLLSDASNYVTATDIFVDGGFLGKGI
jgi:gluconate 5-dehydrogenase